jgi:hypothetical protein
MQLIESIASASSTGDSKRRIDKILTGEVKATIARLVKSPESISQLDPDLCAELIEMDIFRYSEGRLQPNTAIFFEEDIEKLYEPVFSMGVELAEIVKESGKELESFSPPIKNFIGSIMGLGQGLHDILKAMGLASLWQKKTGRYEASKVDFNEDCEAYYQFGYDLQQKRTHRGHHFTGVIIGAGNENYLSCLWNLDQNSANNYGSEFCYYLATYLTDTLPQLIGRKLNDVSLQRIARMTHIEVDDPCSLITAADAEKYQPVIHRITQASAAYYLDNMSRIKELLGSTLVGQLGAPIENLIMNFWRYLRKAIAFMLYKNGFLTDKVPVNGSVTIFYENSIHYF